MQLLSVSEQQSLLGAVSKSLNRSVSFTRYSDAIAINENSFVQVKKSLGLELSGIFLKNSVSLFKLEYAGTLVMMYAVAGIGNSQSHLVKSLTANFGDGVSVYPAKLDVVTSPEELRRFLDGNKDVSCVSKKNGDVVAFQYAGFRIYVNSDTPKQINIFTE